MAKENETEGADLSQNNGDGDQSGQQQDNGQQDQQQGDQQQQDAAQQDGSQEDYRGKLNATNRFLENEGYEFKDGRWHKKPDSSQQQQGSQQQQAPASQAAPSLTREEGILFSQGFTEAQVEQAKKVAALQNLKLTDAVNDPLFTTWKAIEDKKAKDAAAQLGVSRGTKPATKKNFQTKGLSDEDHKELFKEKTGQ